MAKPKRAHYRATATLLQSITLQGRKMTWLAAQCGVSVQHYSRICSAQKPTTEAVARKSSELLGVPVTVLFADERGAA